MKELIALVDYKGHFGSNTYATPYRSGLNLKSLANEFAKNDYELKILHLSQVDFRKDWKDKLVIYTSQEDKHGKYKSYIDNVVQGLEFAGARVIPKLKYLWSHHNKVLMEILRDQSGLESIMNIKARHFGSWEEMVLEKTNLKFPFVLKRADGTLSSSVKLVRSISELKKVVKSLLSPKNGWYFEFKEQVRMRIHKGYKRESKYRGKFIIQEFIPHLKNDWKVMVYAKRYYVYKRQTRKNDFRASGSGREDYLYGSKAEFPKGMLEYAHIVYENFNVPCIGLDIAFDGRNFYLFEFQVVYFGTLGHWRSDCYYALQPDETFKPIFEKLPLEKVYADSIVHYLNK